MKRMATEDRQVNLRLPSELIDQIKRAAELGSRSMTAEVLYRLTRTFEEDSGDAPESDQTTAILIAHQKFLKATIGNSLERLRSEGYDDATLRRVAATIDAIPG